MSSICRLRARSPKSAIAREVAKAGKHVYTEKPIATTGLEIEALEKTYGVTCTVGHSARLMAGIRVIPDAWLIALAAKVSVPVGRCGPCCSVLPQGRITRF